MKKLIMNNGAIVPVTGQCYRGLPSELRFIDSPRCGIYWRPPGESQPLKVDVSIAKYYERFGFLYLRHGRRALPVWEHIGALAWTGLSGVIVESTWHPPHFGRVKEFWEALRPNLVASTEDVSWCRPERTVVWRYPKRDGFTQLDPHLDVREKSLKVRLVSDYKGCGGLEGEFSFPADIDVLLRAFDAYSPAYPPKWKWRIATAASWLGWPHRHRMTWPHKQPDAATIELFLLHRLADLVGAFSLASHRHLPSGVLTSYCSGFEADIEVLRLARFNAIF